MTALLSALGSGVSAKKILNYFIRKSPEMAPKISSALAAGISADQVVKFFSKDKNFEKLKGQLQSQYLTDFNANPIVQGETVRGQNLGSDMASGLQRQAPSLLGGAAALGAGMALKHALPNPLKDPIQRTAEQNPVASQQPPILGNANIQQPVNPVQPEVISNPKEYLEKLGILDRVKSLLKTGNTPEAVAAAIGMKRSGEAKIDPELLKNIEEFSKLSQEEATNLQPEPIKSAEQVVPNLGNMAKGMTDNLYTGLFESLKKGSSKFAGIEDPLLKRAKEPYEKGLIKSPEDLRRFANEKPNETPKIEKKSIVATPNGVGEVREIRGGQAIVDIDGKLTKVKEEELEASPLPEKDLADLYDDLIKGIEGEIGEDVSRMVQWAGYNPTENSLTFLPHTGKLYKYGNISPEDAALLTDILSTRKSSGENFIGAWKAGSKSPIGAALSKLIRKLQSERGGKGNEYEETHEPIYSAYEPAIQAKKKKKKK